MPSASDCRVSALQRAAPLAGNSRPPPTLSRGLADHPAVVQGLAVVGDEGGNLAQGILVYDLLVALDRVRVLRQQLHALAEAEFVRHHQAFAHIGREGRKVRSS